MRVGMSFVRSHTHCQLSILTVLLCMYTLTAVKTITSINTVSVSMCESSTVSVLFLFCPYCTHNSPYQFPKLETKQTCCHTY